MVPVRWQQGKRSAHGLVWEDLIKIGPQLTAAYQAKNIHVAIDAHTLNLAKMQVKGGPKIRCLNSQGEVLAPLKPKSLGQADALSAEALARRLLSKEVIRVKDAADMNLMESVRHFTFLLSKKNLDFVCGRKNKDRNTLEREIEAFSQTIQDTLTTHHGDNFKRPTTAASNDDPIASLNTANPSYSRHATIVTADVATGMFREFAAVRKSQKAAPKMIAIDKENRDRVIYKARRCLARTYDPARPPTPAGGAMTDDQAFLLIVA